MYIYIVLQYKYTSLDQIIGTAIDALYLNDL